jgi:hypothetical protein
MYATLMLRIKTSKSGSLEGELLGRDPRKTKEQEARTLYILSPQEKQFRETRTQQGRLIIQNRQDQLRKQIQEREVHKDVPNARALAKRKKEDDWYWKTAKPGGLPRLTDKDYDYAEMKRRYKPDRNGENIVRADWISPTEIKQWTIACERPDIRRIRLGKAEEDWPSNQSERTRAQKQRGAVWQFLLSTNEGLELAGYTPEDVQEAVDRLEVKYASGDSDDDDIVDGDAPIHPDGALPLLSYIYQIRRTWDHSYGQDGRATRFQRIRFRLDFDAEYGRKKKQKRARPIQVSFCPEGTYCTEQRMWKQETFSKARGTERAFADHRVAIDLAEYRTMSAQVKLTLNDVERVEPACAFLTQVIYPEKNPTTHMLTDSPLHVRGHEWQSALGGRFDLENDGPGFEKNT